VIAEYWTDERVSELKRLHGLGYSSSQIAKELCAISRNAIIGKARRLGLTRPLPRPLRRSSEPSVPSLSVITADIPDTSTDTYPNRVSLIEADESHCRWPAADDGSAMMVCGDEKEPGHSWCPRHCNDGYNRVSEAV
jgi:GcrA cell cycle regulator